MLQVIETQLKFLALPPLSLFDPLPAPSISCSSLTHLHIHTKTLTPTDAHAHTHIVYTTHLHTKCKQRVIDRSLQPASSVCVLIPSAGPASLVHSIRDELLHGSSFFLPGPSPLWPPGRNGKTSLVNYLRVKGCLSYLPHSWAGVWGNECFCGVYSRSGTWQCRNVRRSIWVVCL